MTTIDLTLSFTDSAGDAVDPTTPTIDIWSPIGVLLVDGGALDKVAAIDGVFEYSFVAPTDEDGVYYYYVRATVGGQNPVHAGAFTVRGSGTVLLKGIHAQSNETIRIPLGMNDTAGSAIVLSTGTMTIFGNGEAIHQVAQDITAQVGDNTGEYFGTFPTTTIADGAYRAVFVLNDGTNTPAAAFTFDINALSSLGPDIEIVLVAGGPIPILDEWKLIREWLRDPRFNFELGTMIPSLVTAVPGGDEADRDSHITRRDVGGDHPDLPTVDIVFLGDTGSQTEEPIQVDYTTQQTFTTDRYQMRIRLDIRIGQNQELIYAGIPRTDSVSNLNVIRKVINRTFGKPGGFKVTVNSATMTIKDYRRIGTIIRENVAPGVDELRFWANFTVEEAIPFIGTDAD